jgi:coatomer subunit beta'
VVEYQTVVLRGEMEAAEEMLASIPEDQMPKIARFLEGQGYRDKALEVSTDPEQRFELALQLNKLDVAYQLAESSFPSVTFNLTLPESNIESKWKAVGDAALASWNLALAEEAFKAAKDLGSLLLLYTSTGSRAGLGALASLATQANQNNIAFTCYLSLGDCEKCVEVLLATNRFPEAVLFSRTYKPSLTAGLVEQWKNELAKSGREKIAKTIASPDGNLDLFPAWTESLEAERTNGQNDRITHSMPSFHKASDFKVEEKLGGMSLNDVDTVGDGPAVGVVNE